MTQKTELTELVKQYLTQNNFSTAYPIYFCIEDYVYYPVYSENHHFDRYVLLYKDNPLAYGKDLSELFKNLLLLNESHIITVENVTQIRDDISSFTDNIIIDDDSDQIVIYPEQKVKVFRNMFLFEQEATEHLQKNKHHYSSEAKVYCYHSWRSFDTNRLFNLLKKEYLTDES
jgi:hypothetical protein